MLVGRDAELATLTALAEECRNGRGGARLVLGEPGIGKTALVDELVTRVAIRTLQVRPVESESGLAYAGVHDLLRPLLDQLAGLPDTQAGALRHAFAIGPAIAADQYAVHVAIL